MELGSAEFCKEKGGDKRMEEERCGRIKEKGTGKQFKMVSKGKRRIEEVM